MYGTCTRRKDGPYLDNPRVAELPMVSGKVLLARKTPKKVILRYLAFRGI